jgi:hypothetical protein
MPIEVYLGLAALGAGFYFLWGVCDPQGQQDTEYRWMHAARVRSGAAFRSTTPYAIRLRNGIGLAVCVVLLMLAISELSSDEGEQPSHSTVATAPKKREQVEDFDAMLRHQEEKAEAYYRTKAPGAQPYP